MKRRESKPRNPYYQGPISDHFDGTRFFNPDGAGPGGVVDLLRWQFGGGKVGWPSRHASPFSPAVPEQRLYGNALRVTMIGHASMLLQVAGLNIVTDPVWSQRVSPFSFAGPRRVNDPGIRFADLPPIDVVLVSHNHYDHLDVTTIRNLHAQHDPLFITPLGNDAIVRKAAPLANVVTMDWGDRCDISAEIVVEAAPCHHWSARGTRDQRMALWAAFVISTPAGRIYHVGDTGFHQGRHYREAAEAHDGFRLAILPFGAYEPRWFMKGQHQNPQEAVAGMQLCKAAFVAGHHWGTFQLTNEGIEEPLKALRAALDEAGMAYDRFRALRPGEVFDVPDA